MAANELTERQPLLDVEKALPGDDVHPSRARDTSRRASSSGRWGQRPRLYLLLAVVVGASLYGLTKSLTPTLRGVQPSCSTTEAVPAPDTGAGTTSEASRVGRHRLGRTYDAYTATGQHGAVATENEICSDMGVDILRRGGNALDAAITSTLCIGTVNMFSSGIGGGGFLNVRTPRQCTRSERRQGLLDCADHMTIDFRETAPAASNESMFNDPTLPQFEPHTSAHKYDRLFTESTSVKSKFGGLAVAVPGEVRGLEEAWKRWGSHKSGFAWEDLFRPVVHLAEAGWTVQPLLEQRLNQYENLTKLFTTRPEWGAIFTNNGSLKKAGDKIARPEYGASLAKIAKGGSDAFYYGEIAESIVEKVQHNGGILTSEDLDKYKAIVAPAIEGKWDGRKVWTTPAPSSGPVLLSILRILGLWGKEFATNPSWTSSLSAHRLVEALKFSFGQRTLLADPAFLNSTNRAKIDRIAYDANDSARIHSKVNDSRTWDTRTQEGLAHYEPIFDITQTHGTMSLSVMDKDGMAVVVTSTVNLPFGSQVLDAKTGIMLGDEMDDFATQNQPNGFGLWPSPYNYPAPGKRPLSSMAPTIVEHANGTVMLALGGSGGSRIFPAVLQTMLNLDWGLDLSNAIEFPRLHHQLLPYTIESESTFPPHLLARLKTKGHEHEVIDINEGWAVVQAVQYKTDALTPQYVGASDSRKAGVPAAY